MPGVRPDWPECRDAIALARDGWFPLGEGGDVRGFARTVADALQGEVLLDGSGRREFASMLPDDLRDAVLEALPAARPRGDVASLVREMEGYRDRMSSWAEESTSASPADRGDGTVSFADLVSETLADDAIVTGYVDAPRPAETHMHALDAWLGGGLYPGVNVIMASPGAGKTAFAVQTLAMNALEGRDCVMFSLEMPVDQVKMRVTSMLSVTTDGLEPVGWNATQMVAAKSWLSRVSWPDARASLPREAALIERACGCGEPPDVPLADVADAVRGVPGGLAAVTRVLEAAGDPTVRAYRQAQSRVFPHMAVTSRFRTAEAICAEVARVAETTPRPPLVVLDYLQVVDASAEAARLGEVEATKDVSKRLAACARDTGCPILCITAKRKGGDSGMESVRGSSGIAYDAQAVLCLDEDQDPTRRADGARSGLRPVLLSISKNRFGQTTDEGVPLWFDGAHNSFAEEVG